MLTVEVCMPQPEKVQLVPGPYELVPLSAEDNARWDELVQSYPEFEVFHRQAWLDYLAASQGARIRRWELRGGGRRLGLFCAGEVRKGPFRIWGSPLKGWSTNSMGALLAPDADPDEYLRSLESAARREGVAMLELEQQGFPDRALASAGFAALEGLTYRVELGSEQEMLKRLHKGRRSGVKKAINSGLTAEICDTPDVADEFYDRFVVMMRHKGLAPGFPRAHARLLFEHLHRAGRIFGLRVRDPQGRVLSAGLFPFDNRTLYFWGGADLAEGRQYCPNDFLHWKAMCLGAERGLRCYDMSGYGRFKREFGGELVTTRRWHKAYWRSAHWARQAYAFWHRQKLRFRGWQARLSPAPAATTSDDKDRT